MSRSEHHKEIYLAGGCFWGAEKYLSLIRGVVQTEVGYANGNTENPSYEQVCHGNTGHAEAVKVVYDPQTIALAQLLSLYYESIDPTSLNRQGGDKGVQYRTGIYYVDEADREVIAASVAALQARHRKPVVVEVLPLSNYYPAEAYHQKYLEKNPHGYCHIGADKFDRARRAVVFPVQYAPAPKEALRQSLSDMQYSVTQQNGTEPPFQNEYHDHFAPGIYVDITSGEPLFVSTDKFESGCGWPSFSRPIDDGLIRELPDHSLFAKRTEVRSATADAHLGHVFDDGPRELGGRRYCINSAALRFVPYDQMQAKGYGYLLHLFRE